MRGSTTANAPITTTGNSRARAARPTAAAGVILGAPVALRAAASDASRTPPATNNTRHTTPDP